MLDNQRQSSFCICVEDLSASYLVCIIINSFSAVVGLLSDVKLAR